MDLVISSEEFRRLSVSTQRELLALLGAPEQDAESLYGLDEYEPPPLSTGSPSPANLNAVASTAVRRVYPINAAQAVELLSNLADKSQQTLRLFAMGGWVVLAELVGDTCAYKDMNDLKRSFVGAVNRRLRTVTGDRSAVLFSSDHERRRIRVLPASAAALRRALGIAEPDWSEADPMEPEFGPELDAEFDPEFETS